MNSSWLKKWVYTYKIRMYLRYLQIYHEFTIYVIIHGGHIGVLAAITVVAI